MEDKTTKSPSLLDKSAKHSTVKFVRENITVLTTLILVITLIRLYAKYSVFGVDIVYYIDLIEIPKYSIDILVYGLIFIGVIFLRVNSSEEDSAKEPEEVKQDENIESEETRSPWYRSVLVWVHGALAYIVFYFFIKIYPQTIGTDRINDDFFSGCIILVMISLVGIFILTRFLYKKLSSVFLVIIIFFFSFSMGLFDNIQINSRDYIIFLYEKKIVRSSSSYYKVGETKNYIFMYSEKAQISQIFEKSKITHMTIINAIEYHEKQRYPSKRL